MLAEMIGATRARVRFFMNRVRKLGFIQYTGGRVKKGPNPFESGLKRARLRAGK